MPVRCLPSAGVPAEPAPTTPSKVTPYLLRRADDLCGRRLALEHGGEPGSGDPVNRGRIRAAFLDAARAAHTRDVRLAPPPWTSPSFLEPEEVAVFDQAVHWYWRWFGGKTVSLDDHDLDRPSEVDGLDVRLGGWVDLTVVGVDGTPELRQLDFWGRPPPADLLATWEVRLALLRLGERIGSGEIEISWTDLLGGIHRSTVVDARRARAEARAALDERLAVVRARSARADIGHGADCPACRFHKGCPEFPGALKIGVARNALLPGVLTITPTALDTWHRCRRAWRDEHVLSVPPSDDPGPATHGQQVHALLRLLHRDGPCTGSERIDDLVEAHGAGDRVRAELRAHSRRCPVGARPYGHEFTRNRLWPRRPSFLASARIDAAWIHDGWLDVRDYKTGTVAYDRVAEDPRARLQAWVMAPVAEAEGLRLRLRYEQLASEIPDDPEVWVPDADDLEAVGHELAAVATAMRVEAEWGGAADAGVCRWCRYRSICPESACPGFPGWPRVDDEPAGAR